MAKSVLHHMEGVLDHPAVLAWVAKHPPFHVHSTRTSASWLNTVARFFRSASTDRLERGVFRSVPELICAIEQYLAAHNQNRKSFVWTAKASDIRKKLIRANAHIGLKNDESLQ